MRHLLVASLACGVATSLGCAHRAPPGPANTVRAFAGAVAANRVDDAYQLMSAAYRKSHGRDAFAKSLPTGERRALARAGGAPVTLRAEIELGDGERLSLVAEPEGWRFARDPLDLYPQHAPDEALRSFVRAVERQRWDVMLRFIPQRYRGTLTAELLQKSWTGERRDELQAQLQAVRQHLEEPLELSGDEARLPIGVHKQAKLIREDDGWKIETLE